MRIYTYQYTYSEEGIIPSASVRKLIKLGNSSLVITVPKGWARYYGLKGGEKLLVVVDGEMMIRPFNSQNESKAENNRR